jgi:hypothetical protein
MNDELTEENSWTHSLNPLLNINIDPATLNTVEKRRQVYTNYLNNNKTVGLRRMGILKQVHPNILLAKVEHWIREAQLGR